MATLQHDEVNASIPATPAGPATPETPSRPVNADSIMERPEIPVGEDVIRTCVTPRKVQSVYATLQKE